MSLASVRLNGDKDPDINAFEAAQAQHEPVDGSIAEPQPVQESSVRLSRRKRKKNRKQKQCDKHYETKLETRSGKDVLALQTYIGTKGKLVGGTDKTYIYKVT